MKARWTLLKERDFLVRERARLRQENDRLRSGLTQERTARYPMLSNDLWNTIFLLLVVPFSTSLAVLVATRCAMRREARRDRPDRKLVNRSWGSPPTGRLERSCTEDGRA